MCGVWSVECGGREQEKCSAHTTNITPQGIREVRSVRVHSQRSMPFQVRWRVVDPTVPSNRTCDYQRHHQDGNRLSLSTAHFSSITVATEASIFHSTYRRGCLLSKMWGLFRNMISRSGTWKDRVSTANLGWGVGLAVAAVRCWLRYGGPGCSLGSLPTLFGCRCC